MSFVQITAVYLDTEFFAQVFPLLLVSWLSGRDHAYMTKVVPVPNPRIAMAAIP